MIDDAAGIYVHIPFCLTRCGYCDFNAYAGLDELKPRYLAALLAEAELAAPGWEGTPFVSVFLGGGTPTTVAPADLRALLVHLRDRFDLRDDAEVTIEANPDTVDVASLRGSATPATTGCRWGRSPSMSLSWHRWSGSTSLRRSARRSPPPAGRIRQREPRPDLRRGRRVARVLAADAGRAIALAPDTSRAYALTIEPATALGRQVAAGTRPRPIRDLQADMFAAGVRAAGRGRL